MAHTHTTLAPRGRAALITVLACWAVFLFLKLGGGLVPGGFDGIIANIVVIGSYVAGVTLAIISLVRREPRKLAITTLVLLLAGPLLLFLLAMLVWFGYGLGMG